MVVEQLIVLDSILLVYLVLIWFVLVQVQFMDEVDFLVQVCGYFGCVMQIVVMGVMLELEIKEGVIVQFVNDEQIDGVYKVIFFVLVNMSFVLVIEGGQFIGVNVVWIFNVMYDGGIRIVMFMVMFQVVKDYWGLQIMNSVKVFYIGGVFMDDQWFIYNYSYQFVECFVVLMVDLMVGFVGVGVFVVGVVGMFVL